MKQETSFLKRFLAFAVALVLIASCTNLGVVLSVWAADDSSVSVTDGEIVANHYDLTDEEKALLSSGYLVGETLTYKVPSSGSGLVSVDTENKTITAEEYENWIPVSAIIVVGDETVDTVTLENGEGTYKYDENAFSVLVTYELYHEVSEQTQSVLLNAAADLKQGLANMKGAYDGSDANLGTIAAAVDSLEIMVEGINLGFMVYSFEEEAAEAVKALRAELDANDGKLELEIYNEAYDYSASNASKVQYLVENGDAYKAVIANTYANLKAIMDDELTNHQISDSYLEKNDPTNHTLWLAFKSILAKTVEALEPAATDNWSVLETKPVKDGLTVSDYKNLDALVNAVETISTVEVTNPLLAATETVQENMSMKNVTVKVVLKTASGVADDANLVEYGVVEQTLTLAENATAEEILTAIEKKGIVDSALDGWIKDGVIADGHFGVSTTELPETLTKDIEYTVTCEPVNYEVTFGYTEALNVPYGYKMTLPVHENAEMAYDYKVNDTAHAQGEVVTITGETYVTRTEGKAYTAGNLLQIIANNYGNEYLDAILVSGALIGNEAVNVRYPDGNGAELLTLVGGKLTAKEYDASYNNMTWVPYSYGSVDGTENLFENGSEYDGETAYVIYRLYLDNYEGAAAEWQALAVTLAEEAQAQLSNLNELLGQTDAMSELNKTKLGGLNGTIDVTDLNSDANKNAELKVIFKTAVTGVINNCLTGSTLTLNDMLNEYAADGLTYYYKNSEAFLAELDKLTGYLNELTADEDCIAALRILTNELGYSGYAERIEEIAATLNRINNELKAPNAAIDLDSANLSDLVDALVAAKDATSDELKDYTAGTLYLTSGKLKVSDTSMRSVEVYVDGVMAADITVSIAEFTSLTQAHVDELKTQLDAYVADIYGANIKYYDVVADQAIEDLVGEQVADMKINYTYTAKKYTVKVEGMADQTVTINGMKVNLAKSENKNFVYSYTVDGGSVQTANYTFTTEQLDRLFTDGTYSITRTVTDLREADLETLRDTMNDSLGENTVILTKENGTYTGFTVNVTAEEMMDFVMGLTGYSYIGLNGEGLMYLTEDADGYLVTEVSLQTIINALLNDENFNNDGIIALAENGKGTVLTTSMQLGSDEDDLAYDNLTFTLNLTSIPAAVTNNVGYVKKLSNYVTFQSNAGVLDVNVTLPEQVYGAYVAVIVASGEVDKADAGAVERAVAAQFAYDYLAVLLEDDVDLVTITNTLNMLGIEKDVTGYNNYYNGVVDSVEVAVDDEGAVIVDICAPGKQTLDVLMDKGGIQIKDAYLVMLKEYKEGNTLEVTVVAELENDSCAALIVDAEASSKRDMFEAPATYSRLAAETKTLAGYSAIVLLNDVEGDLTIGGTTVLDLNGKNVNGTITSTGKLYIIDSSIGTYDAGTVENVSGDVVIIGGNYESDVSAYLKDGYYMDGTTVRNALYYVTEVDGTTTLVLNGDVYKDEHVDGYLPSVKALAVDIAADLALNLFPAASLTIEGYELCDAELNDVVGLYADDNTVTNLVKSVLGWFTVGEAGYDNWAGFEGVVNTILEDLLDFDAIADALNNNTALATYSVAVNALDIEIEHIDDGNYLTLNVVNNGERSKEGKIALVIESSINDNIAAVVEELAKIVEDETEIVVDIPNPTYSNKTLTVTGAGKATVSVDMTYTDDYAVMIGVILAYGNPDKAADVAEAVNNGDMAALKEVVDNTSVKEVFTALKVMSLNVDYAAMAKTVGVNADTADVAELEGLFHEMLCAAGKVLEKLDITGMGSKLGSLYNDETGYYELTLETVFDSAELNKVVDITKRGYTGVLDVTVDEATLKVKLFNIVEEPETELYLMGDINIDGKVNFVDLNLIYAIVYENNNDLTDAIKSDDYSNYVQRIVANVAEVEEDNLNFVDLNLLYTYVANLNNSEYDGWVPYYIEIPVQ